MSSHKRWMGNGKFKVAVLPNSGQVKDGASCALTLKKFDICCFPFKCSPQHATSRSAHLHHFGEPVLHRK